MPLSILSLVDWIIQHVYGCKNWCKMLCPFLFFSRSFQSEFHWDNNSPSMYINPSRILGPGNWEKKFSHIPHLEIMFLWDVVTILRLPLEVLVARANYVGCSVKPWYCICNFLYLWYLWPIYCCLNFNWTICPLRLETSQSCCCVKDLLVVLIGAWHSFLVGTKNWEPLRSESWYHLPSSPIFSSLFFTPSSFITYLFLPSFSLHPFPIHCLICAVVSYIFDFYLQCKFTRSLPRVFNFKFPLQPHQKYNITQCGELGLLRMIILPILSTSLILFSLEGWEKVLNLEVTAGSCLLILSGLQERRDCVSGRIMSRAAQLSLSKIRNSQAKWVEPWGFLVVQENLWQALVHFFNQRFPGCGMHKWWCCSCEASGWFVQKVAPLKSQTSQV